MANPVRTAPAKTRWERPLAAGLNARAGGASGSTFMLITTKGDNGLESEGSLPPGPPWQRRDGFVDFIGKSTRAFMAAAASKHDKGGAFLLFSTVRADSGGGQPERAAAAGVACESCEVRWTD